MLHVAFNALARSSWGLLLLLSLLMLPAVVRPARAQAPIGRWQLHVPTTSAITLTRQGEVVYSAGYTGFVRYDPTDGSIRTLSRQDGFSGDNVAALTTASTTGELVIAYDDANLDLLAADGRTIRNLDDIKRKTITGTKRINSIQVAGNLAYLATTFGIVVIDLARLEVRDTYANLGATGEVINIYSTAQLGDLLFAATSQGLLMGDRRTNLLDFNNWRRTPLAAPRSLAVLDGAVYLLDDGAGLRRYTNGSWPVVLPVSETIVPQSLTATPDGQLTIARRNGFSTYVPATATATDYFFPDVVDYLWQVIRGTDNTFLLAAPNRGLFRLAADGTPPQLLAANGPVANVSWATLPVGADTWAVAGGYSVNGGEGTGLRVGFSRLHEGRWENFSAQTLPQAGQYPAGFDIDQSGLAYNPVNGKLYIGSYGNGLLEWTGPGDWRRFDASNSPLITSIPGDPGYTRVPGVAVDAAGIVWVVNYHPEPNLNGTPGLFSFNPTTGVWAPHLAGVADPWNRARIVIDDNGYKWLSPPQLRGANLLVYDDVSGHSRLLTGTSTDGALLDNGAVTALAKDRKGDIWIGTTKGMQVIYNPGSVLQGFPNYGPVATAQPIIDRRPLLDGQTVTAIAIDGGNRKWVGTNDGLWLFGPDGDVLVANFTTANSPLPTNKILSLSVNGVTGDVFVGTDRGLIAYRGGATDASETEAPTCAKVFPNPVPRQFSGQVALDNLAPNAQVKITDVAGMLVYQTTANGGRAVWNARDYNGRRVRTGIYLAYTSDVDGGNTCVSKIAVLGE